MFITGIVTPFLHYAELIVKNYTFHSTLVYRPTCIAWCDADRV